ncbi:TRAP transporter permease [Hoeflea prorocentri]|uniref:TRAP transporter permease n=1 Tax=Hoeflea prorocentri TaxID=1922333 RepID=A0A9X3UNR7_9HYPH|nr:TRAP transporter permease [Hoeflea prorocentri]MCY6382624.1 TRAP transporter permease [Hoeflea prorocentri]MDA5400424.1 TRAP transporter permease [Hoeflea prorocentri]
MAQDDTTTGKLSDEALEDLVASTDTGGRKPTNRSIALLIAGTALAWSIFQVWIASPIPYTTGFGVFSSGEARPIHLAFALFLAYLAYPAFKNSPRRTVPTTDWILACVAAFCSLYLFFFDSEIVKQIFGTRLSDRPNNPNQMDVIVSVVGIILLLEATRRALGPPLMIVALVFLGYTFLGPYAPGILAWKGASFNAVAYHQWLSTEGVFGIALGVSTDLVFLFVLFGALLDKAGAGNYFIKVAFSLMGHLSGGPAKAAVVASGMTGLISGSSIANVVTTGTFTIPMMRRVGFSPEKAGAVEVASSVNGQIMPPVMGAAAFLMVEYIGISYFEVVKHAFVPAVISYIALVYIVHLEAKKLGMAGLDRATKPKPLKWGLISFGVTMAIILAAASGIYYLFLAFEALKEADDKVLAIAVVLGIIFTVFTMLGSRLSEERRMQLISTGAMVLGLTVISAFGVFYLVETIGNLAGDATPWIIAVLLGIAYVALVRFCSSFPELELDDPNEPVIRLPEPGPTVKSGLHFLLPVIVLIWCLMVERLSPSLSAFWATAFMIFILLTQRPLFAIFRNESREGTFALGFSELIDGMIAGARNMIGIGIATAAAGIIVGAVSQTGVGSVLAALVEFLSQGQIMLILIFTAILSLILGMGLPTTANYIVVSSLLAPVIVALGQQNGLIVPLIAVHLFVFYFGIMADVTPPVGLASFAAAAVSGGDPIRTGFVAFFYSLRTALLPFLFIFNTDLLLIDVTWAQGVFIFIVATAAMLIFTAGSQGYFVARSRIWESIALLLIAFTLFRPGFWMDYVSPPFESVNPTEIATVMGEAEPGSQLRTIVQGLDDVGDPITLTMVIDVGDEPTGEERLEAFGLEVLDDGGKLLVDNAIFDSKAQAAGFDFDQEISQLLVPTPQPSKYLFYIPALALLALIFLLQRRRNDAAGPEPVEQGA